MAPCGTSVSFALGASCGRPEAKLVADDAATAHIAVTVVRILHLTRMEVTVALPRPWRGLRKWSVYLLDCQQRAPVARLCLSVPHLRIPRTPVQRVGQRPVIQVC